MNIKHIIIYTVSAWSIATAAIPFQAIATDTSELTPAESRISEQQKKMLKNLIYTLLQQDPEYAEIFQNKVREDRRANAFAYLAGINREQDIEKGLAILSDLAKSGDAAAQSYIGHIYIQGICGLQYYDTGVELIKKAAQKGRIEAIYSMMLISAAEDDFESAQHWTDKFNEYAERNPRVFQYFEMVMKPSLLQNARNGDAGAQYDISICYLYGLYPFDQDDFNAFYWCKEAAEHGHPSAVWLLALLYEDGIGTKRNHEEALNCMKKLIKLGMPGAQEAYDELKTAK